MTDETIESEIQAKGLTAPRVTPKDIEDNIVSKFFFSAQDGALGSKRLGSSHFHHHMVPPELRLLTFCVLVLRNGFTVTGESACVSLENYDAEIGRKIAFENAKQKIWPLMGYELRTRLDALRNAG
jgi:hypothetical protein